MNARTARDDMSFVLPPTMSHYFRDEPQTEAVEADHPGLLSRIGSALRWLAEMPKRQAVLDELNMLSDHELADIGLTRADVPRVFDPAFAHEHDARRAAPRGSYRPFAAY